MLGLEPDGSELRASPVLPERIGGLDLRAIPFRGDRVDVTANREEALR